MAINFPATPANGVTHTDAGTTWVFSSADNSWTVTSVTDPGVNNGTNYENSLVVLDNVGGSPTKNLPIAAQGLEFNPTDKRLTIKTLASQSAKPFAILDSAGAELNAFNIRGILEKAGRIYYAASAPTVNSADTGQLWYDTANSTLKVSNASAGFDNAFNTANLVTTNSTQTITSPKTFNAGITASGVTVSSNGTVAFSGSSTITNSGSISLAGNFTGNPIFTGNPDFIGQVDFTDTTRFSGSSVILEGNCENLYFSPSSTTTSTIACNSSTSGTAGSNDLQLSLNKSAAGRKIVLYSNIVGDPIGVLIKPTNGANIGRLQIDGATTVNGNFNVTGGTVTLPNTSYIPGLSTIGSFRNITADTTYNLTTLPTPIGPLTFSGGVYSNPSGAHTVSLDITNTSTSPVSFYFRREINSAITKFILQKVTMAASTTWNIANIFVVGGTTPATGVTVAYMGSDDAVPSASTTTLASSVKTALILTITLI